jgi:hypothetical protein
VALAGWVNREQQVIEYFLEENRVLRATFPPLYRVRAAGETPEVPATKVLEEGHLFEEVHQAAAFLGHRRFRRRSEQRPCWSCRRVQQVRVRGPREQEFLIPGRLNLNGMILDFCGTTSSWSSSFERSSWKVWPGVIGTDRSRREADFAIRLQAPCKAGPRQ